MCMRFFAKPTHTVFLGDHMSSQWIDDAEFHRRSQRFKNRLLQRKPGEIVYNITGNHDVGYAGDMTGFRINRWHDMYGPTNFVDELVTTTLAPGTPSIRIVGLNDLLLDGPANDEDLRSRTLEFIHDLPTSDLSTVLLTHVPLHKRSGLCTDQPYMSFYEQPRTLLREQNFLTPESTKAVLNQVFWDSGGIVLTGHDHTGCHVLHSTPTEIESFWTADTFSDRHRNKLEGAGIKTIEEVTVRSVMGQYGGNAGLLTARFDSKSGAWRFEYTAVPFVHNTVWWVIHILTSIFVLYFSCYLLLTRTGTSQKLTSTLQRFQSRRQRFDTTILLSSASVTNSSRKMKLRTL